MAAENIIFNRRATQAWQSSSCSRQALPIQIDPSIALRLEASPGGRPGDPITGFTRYWRSQTNCKGAPSGSGGLWTGASCGQGRG